MSSKRRDVFCFLFWGYASIVCHLGNGFKLYDVKCYICCYSHFKAQLWRASSSVENRDDGAQERSNGACDDSEGSQLDDQEI